MIDWLIQYHDGSTFSSADGPPHAAPRNGVMQVFYMDEATGVSVETSPEGYWVWKSNRWFGTDQMGYWDYRFHWMEPQVAIYGRTMHNEEWEGEIRLKSQELLGTPKSAWRQRERRP